MSGWEAVGWLANICFFSRFAVQWWHAERNRTTLAPPLFWYLSLAGSLLLGAYALQRDVPILLVGYATNSLIYLRNLALLGKPSSPVSPWGAMAIGFVALSALIAAGIAGSTLSPDESVLWLVCAVVGQGIWSGRFVVQWWYSERRSISHFPPAFWVYSLAGNSLLLLYALHLRDPIFIAGLLPGPVIQIRNLVLAGRGQTSHSTPPQMAAAGSHETA